MTNDADKQTAQPQMPTFWNRKAVPYILATLLNGGVIAGFQAPKIFNAPPQNISEVTTIARDNSATIKSVKTGVDGLVASQAAISELLPQLKLLLIQGNEAARLQREAFIEMTTTFSIFHQEMVRARDRRVGVFSPLPDTVSNSASLWNRFGVIGAASAAEVSRD